MTGDPGGLRPSRSRALVYAMHMEAPGESLFSLAECSQAAVLQGQPCRPRSQLHSPGTMTDSRRMQTHCGGRQQMMWRAPMIGGPHLCAPHHHVTLRRERLGVAVRRRRRQQMTMPALPVGRVRQGVA